jgi:hypothetical protein
MLAPRLGRHHVGDHRRRGRMQHALEHADDDQRGRHRGGAMHQIKKQEAKADAAGRHQQHWTPADPIGNAADERRRQQLATGIAAEQ